MLPFTLEFQGKGHLMLKNDKLVAIVLKKKNNVMHVRQDFRLRACAAYDSQRLPHQILAEYL